MLEELLNKRAYWTKEKISEFNNSVSVSSSKDLLFAWEWTDSGFFYISNSLVEFTNIDTSEHYSLNSVVLPNSWDLYRQVYIKGSRAKSIKIEAPMFREITSVNGETFEYMFTRMHGARIDKFQFLNFDEYLMSIVDDVYQYLLILKEVAQENNCQLPYVNFADRVKTNIGFQWKRPMSPWNKSMDKVVNSCNEQLSVALEIFPNHTYLSEEQIANILKQANEKWGQLL